MTAETVDPGRMTRRRVLGALAAVPLIASTAHGQGAYPARPLKLVVPFAPGGTGDLLARLVAERLGEALGQPVFVEYRPGAGATIGTEAVARGPADGYTLLLSNNLGTGTAPLVHENVQYRSLQDFAHVFLIGTAANAFVVRADHPAKSMGEFLAMARARPGALTYGSAGPGSAGHLTGILLETRAGVRLTHVAYHGTAPALIDLLSGQIDGMFDGVPTATQHVRGGRVRLLAVSSARRVPVFADVPTLDEIVPGVVGLAWFGVSVPARTPRDVVERLEREGMRIVAAPDMQAKLAELGMFPGTMGSAEYTRFTDAEIRNWTLVVRTMRTRAE